MNFFTIEFTPQFANRDIDNSLGGRGPAAPNIRDELLPGNNSIRPARKIMDQLDFKRSQMLFRPV